MPDYYAEHNIMDNGQSYIKRTPREKLLIELIATSVYIIKTTTVSSGDIQAHPRAVIPSFESNRGQVTRK